MLRIFVIDTGEEIGCRCTPQHGGGDSVMQNHHVRAAAEVFEAVRGRHQIHPGSQLCTSQNS